MKLIDPYTGEMECKVYGEKHFASIKPLSNGKYHYGSWQCMNKCKLLELKSIPKGTDPKKAKLLRLFRKRMREMEKDMPFKDGIFDI